VLPAFAETGEGQTSWVRDVLNKPPDHDGMSNAPKVGQNRDRLIKEAHQQMGMDAVSYYNFIFCGPTKVGKSTLINAIRGVKPNDKDAAQVGSSEVTRDVGCYEYFGLPRVKLCDAQGAGTRSHPAATYFMDKNLYAFGCMFLLYLIILNPIDMMAAFSSVVGTFLKKHTHGEACGLLAYQSR